MTSSPGVASPTSAPRGQVGRSMGRLDAAEKLRGEALFVADMDVPGALQGAVARSPVASARILSIDTSAADLIPGVVAILTGQDLLDIDPYYGHAIRDRPILAIDRVRFAGEPVAAVAAVDLATAERAVAAIVISYEELPIVRDVSDALASAAPLVHDGPLRAGAYHGLGEMPERDGNVCYSYALDRGATDEAFRSAEVVVEGVYRFPAVYQYAMETHTVVAEFARGEITVRASCQHPFLVRAELSTLFGLPLDRVRVMVPYLGGGFGSKSYTKMEPIAVALARKAGRPVRIVNYVNESMLTTRRHSMVARVRTAARRDGTLVARDVECWFDTGAYADNGPRVTATGGDSAAGPYRWAATRIRSHCVYTNTAPSGSYRAFGASHLQWIGDLQIDEIARRVGMDRLSIRRMNLLAPGDEVRPGGRPLDADLVGDLERVAAALRWDSPRQPGIGRGISVGLLAAGAHPVSSAIVRMEADGSVTVATGSTELGQGQRTVFAQIAAEVLGLASEHVRCLGTDTHFTPYDRSTGASRSTTVAGLAVMRAAEAVRDDLLSIARGLWGEDAEVELAEGEARSEGRMRRYPDLIAQRFGLAGGQLIGEAVVHPEGSGSFAEGPVFWEVCIGAAEVAVDRETGLVTVLRTATVADVGRAINPQLVERQDEGATMQGIGNALFEELVFDDGLLVNGSLLDYRIPTTRDLPLDSTCVIVENGDGPGPFGAKGCGEGALAGIVGAVAAAVADAGVAVTELPLTPERVWRGLNQRQQEAS